MRVYSIQQQVNGIWKTAISLCRERLCTMTSHFYTRCSTCPCSSLNPATGCQELLLGVLVAIVELLVLEPPSLEPIFHCACTQTSASPWLSLFSPQLQQVLQENHNTGPKALNKCSMARPNWRWQPSWLKQNHAK